MAFSEDFVWGVAAASYQLEGAVYEDGRGECIWHRFSHTPGKVMNGDTGDVACDHYHRYVDDVALMKHIGVDAYRLSIAWARILPQGVGQVNAKGVDFYDRLLDEMLRAGIEPYVTLYHWDLPQALQDRGGWANPDSVQWFADYCGIVAEKYGDRVKKWITLNEPWCIAFLGNYFGVHAPGLTDLRTAYQVAHHVLLGHGAAVPRIRAASPDSEVGITIHFTPSYPASDSPEDIAAAERDRSFINRWFIEPVFKGKYPENLVEFYGDTLKHIDLNAVQAAAVPIDFLGVNFYSRGVFKHDETAYPIKTMGVHSKDAEFTAMGWEIYPDAFRDLLIWIRDNYQPKAIYITENGSAFDDPVPTDRTEVVEDPQRVAYLDKHLNALQEAIAAGVPVKGYFAWSLMDNFEWAYGYEKRFGMVYVDYATQRRILKRTAIRYQEYIRASRA